MEEISCSESTAPLEFNAGVCQEYLGGLSVAVERCPLCSEANRRFYCRTCVERGQFVHSNATYPDSYEAKYRRWDIIKRERDQVLDRFVKETGQLVSKDEKRMAIEQCKRNIELLKLSLKATRDLINKDKANIERVRKDNQIRYAKGKRHREKRRRIIEYVEKVTDTIRMKHEKLDGKHTELMELRQNYIKDLTTYIFPVLEVKNKGDSVTLDGSETVRALHEACQTAYVRGRWISCSSQYKIVEPSLPAHGEYSQYNLMVARTKEDGTLEAVSPESPGNSIIAGLCYTSQLVGLLSHILGVFLPKRQCYSEFSVSHLSEKQFNSAVCRLNKNILYLCFSQGVDTENLEPKHTLHNVLQLINHQELGRIGSFHVVQDMIDSVEDSNGQSEESDDDLHLGSEDPDAADWERVPENIPIPVPAQQETASIQNMGYVSQDMTNSALTASGVISSAYNTVSSLFNFRR